MRLQDKVVLVTASTRGIGLATVQACAKEGAIVYMAARNLERASQRAEELNAMGYRVRTVYNDATDLESYRTMIEEVVKLDVQYIDNWSLWGDIKILFKTVYVVFAGRGAK